MFAKIMCGDVQTKNNLKAQGMLLSRRLHHILTTESNHKPNQSTTMISLETKETTTWARSEELISDEFHEHHRRTFRHFTLYSYLLPNLDSGCQAQNL